MSLLDFDGVRAEPDGAEWSDWWQAFLKGGMLPTVVGAPSLRVVDLFCGAGGFGVGASLAARAHGYRAHFERIVDVDRGALKVYKGNLSVGKAFDTPASSLVDYQVRKRRKKFEFSYKPEIVDPEFEMPEPPDILIAGPPCQGHSNLNNHTRRDDPRNELLFCAVAIAVALEVPAIIIENVAGIGNAKGDVLDVARDLLEGSGYDVSGSLVGADDLGWAQTRRRYFLTAIRKTYKREGFRKLPFRESRNVMWAIGDLVDIEQKEHVFDEAPRHREENLARIEWLFNNEEHDLPNEERPDCHKDGTTYNAVYGRMYNDRPAPTITTGFGTPGQGRFIHPTERRLITPHEAARIQGFPDTFRFFRKGEMPKRKDLAKWIGDAVPSFLGFHICDQVLNSLNLKEVPR